MVMIDLNIREHLGSNVGIWSGDRYRPDCNRFGMFGGLMTQGCNVGWGAPVGNTAWSYAGRSNPYYAWANEAQRVEREERGRAMLETGVMPGPYWSSSGRSMSATNIYTGQTYGTPGFGYYGNDRFGNGAQISGIFNSRANFVDFNFSNNSFGRPQFGGQRAAFDVGLNLGNVNLNVGGVINNLFHHHR